MPALTFEGEDEEDAARGRQQRHTELMEVAGQPGEPLPELIKELADKKKRQLSLADLFNHPASTAVTAGWERVPPTLVHLLAITGGKRRSKYIGREVSTTDGLSLLLSHTYRAAQAAAAAAADAAAADAPADAADAAMSDDVASAGSVATADGSDAKARLRRCSRECCEWGLKDVGGLGQLLDCCAHSPFAWAVDHGYVERALWLYNASLTEVELRGGKVADADPEPTDAVESGEESAEEARQLAPLRRAASVLAGSRPHAEAAEYPPLAHAPMRQMLLLLATRRVLPAAAMSRQLAVATAACGAAGWPCGGMDDASSGAEQLTTPDCHAVETLPTFVYSTESVPFDVAPHWAAAGRPHDGCKCTANRTKFCGETCGCNKGRSECGYGCVCVVEARSCVNRKMQRGLRKQLSLRNCGHGKGWGVFAAESIRAGDFVIEYVGEIISEEEVRASPPPGTLIPRPIIMT